MFFPPFLQTWVRWRFTYTFGCYSIPLVSFSLGKPPTPCNTFSYHGIIDFLVNFIMSCILRSSDYFLTWSSIFVLYSLASWFWALKAFYDFSSFKFVRMGFMAQNVVCFGEHSICIPLLLDEVVHRWQIQFGSMVVLRSARSLLTLCLLNLTISERGVLRSPAIV